ncbi:sugar phosphate isomerase/epimerase family protein [Secundilactobacillus kimchicus]|uniref:Xylose isomerase-like TIM barrel domain-containing protein n=1 Tax=Secundilactobacillus kimchicus JCM 15530 TaxID=1302272 RepID=A0A0R1HM42_9LACO|nr:TIM barrel protein [Secundilactobacillus kimchicus]KRK47432.1 hypothetical protein FC96_GL002553 [Secundilactobacillus kimchicus JCM 15530]
MKVSVNTAVFLADIKNGRSQADCVASLSNKPIENVEVRGELFDPATEQEALTAIRKTCDDQQFGLYYSIPEELLIDGQLNPALEHYIQLGNQFSMNGLKISLGKADRISKETLRDLAQLASTSSALITVENQPNENAELPAFADQLNEILTAVSALGYTFDSGNWYWIDTAPEKAFDLLQTEIDVFHLKDIANRETVMLGDGQTDWQSMLRALNEDVPVFLEYAIEADRLDQQIQLVNTVLASR